MIHFNVLTRYDRVPEILSVGWFCGIFELAVTHSMLFIGQFSFYTSVLRYWRIVYRPNASEFEERKFKKIIVILHLVIPALLSLLNAISNGKIDQWFFVDHCWSFNSLKESSSVLNSEKLEDFFCVNREYDVAMYFDKDVKNLITSILRGLCGSLKIFHLIFLSNVIEMILYGLITKFLNR